jgi:hypothetical protein
MGGRGSGRRWRVGAADCTDDYRSLDVRRWQREGLLTHGSWFRWQWTRNGSTVASIHVMTDADHVTLAYRHRQGGEDWRAEEYPVALSWTRCTFGGRRAWFLCPATGCGRRVAILYGGAIFACRHCYRLAYRSQREDMGDRAARKAEKIRARLGWEPGVLNGCSDKPRGMHWRTFERLVNRHDELADLSVAYVMHQFGLLRAGEPQGA